MGLHNGYSEQMTRREWISKLPAGLALVKSAQMKGQNVQQNIQTAKIAVAAQRTFGLHLLRELIDRKPAKNVFISPLSVFLALHMTENGAAGATRTAMLKTLGLPALDAEKLNASSAALQSLLKAGDPAALNIANALWADRHFTLTPAFVKQCESIFNAHAASLDFTDPKSTAEMNDWVKTNTKGKIGDIVTYDAVRKAAVVLVNAVYFAGKWRSEFQTSQTSDQPFHKTGGSTKSVPMMQQTRLTGAYRSGSNFEGALLFYKESSMFFYALLPQSGKTPKDVLASLDLEHLTSGPSEFDLNLKLPRFTLDFSASLVEDLKKMGMDVAFHYPQADFSPIGSKEFYISDVIHKTRLEVDEKGTVAAAATAVMMRAGAAMAMQRPVKTLVFDRPFALLIGESQSGAVLFAGAIEDP
jgi:serine protease inhibitor